MNRKNYLSLFVVLGLLVTLPIITASLAKQGFEIRISALEDDSPQKVVVSDVGSDSFRVTWLTEREVIGGVKVEGSSFYENEKTSFHTIEVNSLRSGTLYSFILLSDSKEFLAEEGKSYDVTTSTVSLKNGDFLVYGQVFSPDGYTFQQGGIITIFLSNDLGESQVLSSIINETGGYQFNLGNVRLDDFSGLFDYKGNVSATFTIYTSFDSPEFEKVFPVDFSTNRQIPNIYLGDVNIDVIPAIDGEM